MTFKANPFDLEQPGASAVPPPTPTLHCNWAIPPNPSDLLSPQFLTQG